MDWTILLLDFAPLLVFVVIDSFSTTRYAVVGAVAAAQGLPGVQIFNINWIFLLRMPCAAPSPAFG